MKDERKKGASAFAKLPLSLAVAERVGGTRVCNGGLIAALLHRARK